MPRRDRYLCTYLDNNRLDIPPQQRGGGSTLGLGTYSISITSPKNRPTCIDPSAGQVSLPLTRCAVSTLGAIQSSDRQKRENSETRGHNGALLLLDGETKATGIVISDEKTVVVVLYKPDP